MGLLAKIFLVLIVIYVIYLWNPTWFAPGENAINEIIMDFKNRPSSSERYTPLQEENSMGIANYLRGSSVATPTCGPVYMPQN